MIGDNEGDGDSGSTEIAIAKGDGGLLDITDLGVSQSKEGGRGESPVRRSEAGDIGPEKVSYSAALVDGKLGLDLQPDFVVKEGVAEVSISKEVFADVEPLWKCFVVGYFMNDAPHIGSIHATVNRIWNPPGKKAKIDVQFIGKTTVLFRIEDAAVRNRILNRKFWHISEVPLMLGEWTPETAHSPPDLSAMPLWVDLLNVPGYLYSKEGLKFLARTSGKFIKLHPNTERCIRMDVARVLVEVDLTKPLPNKISFQSREGLPVLVPISYPWLPPRCLTCSKWGHSATGCRVQRPLPHVQPPTEDATTGCETDIVELEGFSSKDNVESSSSEIVTKLLTELESISGRENLSSKTPPVEAVDLRNSEQQVEEIKEKEWALVTLKSGGMASPGKVVKAVQGCTSLNGFQILQDLREEGEINEDDVDDEDDDESVDEVGAVVVVEEDGARGIGGQDAGNTTVTAAQTEVEEAIGSKIPPKNSSSIRGRGRGSKRLIVSSRGLVHAVVHQQKVQNSSKKASSRKH